jgi:uncharacterized protein HemX
MTQHATTADGERRPKEPVRKGSRPAPLPSRRKGGASDLTVTVLASIAIALPLAFYLKQHVSILRYGYEIESLQEQRAQLDERSRELRAERSQAASLGTVEARAAELGLAPPQASDVYIAGEEVDARGAGGPAGPGSIARLE